MSTTQHDPRAELLRFEWQPQPQAAQLVAELLDQHRRALPAVATFEQALLEQTGTRLTDWLDHLAVDNLADLKKRLAAAGFARQPQGDAVALEIWRHPGGMFPAILSRSDGAAGLALKVESFGDFQAACAKHFAAEFPLAGGEISGPPTAALRTLRLANTKTSQLWALERHGHTGFDPAAAPAPPAELIQKHRAAFANRPRDDEHGFAAAAELSAAAIADLGQPRTCELFFAAERAYWQSRNRAAQIQHARQAALGLGWANHDHHTYRSSREHFADLVAALEQLGLACRERFYAGREAGWGAQVMENPTAGIVVFADVDLAAEEVTGDFAHQPLPPTQQLGTVGLWCKLHGEAFLSAGMHHLECQFDFDAARAGLAAQGIESMAPFTNFPFLKQSFTKGERWKVDQARIDAALAEGYISRDQAAEFAQHGAIGSHLEVLERNDGYKGFNQTGVSQIIRETDPRRQ